MTMMLGKSQVADCGNIRSTHAKLPKFQMAMLGTSPPIGTVPTAKKACPGTHQDATTLHRAKHKIKFGISLTQYNLRGGAVTLDQ